VRAKCQLRRCGKFQDSSFGLLLLYLIFFFRLGLNGLNSDGVVRCMIYQFQHSEQVGWTAGKAGWTDGSDILEFVLLYLWGKTRRRNAKRNAKCQTQNAKKVCVKKVIPGIPLTTLHASFFKIPIVLRLETGCANGLPTN
jgi:hypothetical protein